MSQHGRHLLILHISVLLFGFTGILGRLITLNSQDLVWYRMLIASLGVLVYLIFAGKFTIPSKKNLVLLLLTGGIISAHWITFFEAIKVSTISVTLACLSSASVFTALLEPLFFGRRIRSYEMAVGLIVIVAIGLIFQFESEYHWGIILALCSAFLAALFTVLNGKLISRMDPGPISFYELGFGWLVITFWFLFAGRFEIEFFQIEQMDVLWLLILGLVCTSFAFVMSVLVMRSISPFAVTLIVNLEPVYAIVLAFIIFGESERMHTGSYIGAAILIGALFLNGYMARKKGHVQ